ncbi:MAG: serine/threonine protein kinase [Deltaproteobacteria bacterium]|nr:MAG: serine/threonine protein kinase [Deltaproteobacteria bacterium]
MEMRAPGTVLAGRYCLDEVLGKGGFAVTWAATDLRDGGRVAVKELRLDRAPDWEAIRHFEREARVLRGLRHPRIPAYIDFVAPEPGPDGTFLLVQELAPGRALSRRMADGWRPDVDAVRDIAVRVLETLVHLHGLAPPVLHRDITPGNLILSDDGEVMLVDFGAVRDRIAGQSSFGSVVGTYGYMAPEQYQGTARPQSDLYNLGATLAHLLTGRRPSELPHRRLRIDLGAATHLTGPLRRWLERMLEPAPEDRFPSAQAALDALRACDSEGPVPTVKLGIEARAEAAPEDRLDIALKDGAPGEARWLAVPIGVGFALLAWSIAEGAIKRPLLPLVFLAVIAVSLFILKGWPLIAGGTAHAHLHLDREGWFLERRVLGYRWRQAHGPLSELRGVDADVRSGRGARHGVALITARRGHLVARHLDEETRARVAALVEDFLARHRD